MQNLTIVGSGRFAKVLCELLKADFEITILTRDENRAKQDKYLKKFNPTENFEKAYHGKRTIIYSVPIHSLETTLKDQLDHLKDHHTIIDVLSVKVHPKKLYQKMLRGKATQVILTHPMFGPDSAKNGFKDLPIMLDNLSASSKNYQNWKKICKKNGLKIVEMSAEEHDRLAANTQGLTHFIGRLLNEFDLPKTPIDTSGIKKLQEIREQTCHDTWELFLGLQNYNPYTKRMRLKLGDIYDRLFNRLLPERISKDYIVFGIQGDKGSFNEQALQDYAKRHNIKNFKVKYLRTTERVLSELHKGNIDYGQFAMHNSIGGVVQESIQAAARHKFKIVEEFAIIIAHYMMKRSDAKVEEIDTIMTHPQVLKQCKSNLAEKYPHLKKTSGKGDLIGHATVAKQMSQKKIPKNVAVMGPEILSKIYNLDIIDKNLQDSKQNYTTFLMTKRG
ncbi:prephenate dehydrogenase/arogenate dehydrogenase family protein [Candidatus Peregrinibacteria bacterium]|nr:prephenate dehydrogenase/arogenate dehydrogenase family protein [Candidatus Peregrinibacteria bacterium]